MFNSLSITLKQTISTKYNTEEIFYHLSFSKAFWKREVQPVQCLYDLLQKQRNRLILTITLVKYVEYSPRMIVKIISIICFFA